MSSGSHKQWGNAISLVMVRRMVMLLLGFAIHASANDTLILVLGGQSAVYQQVAAEFSQQAGDTLNVELLTTSDRMPDAAGRLVIMAGFRAADFVLARTTDCICMALLMTSTAFQAIVREGKQSASLFEAGKLSAVYFDQSPRRQLMLAEMISPEVRSIGIIYDARSEQVAEMFAGAALNLGIDFRMRSIVSSGNPMKTLGSMYEGVDLFQAIPGDYIFNRVTAKWMLYQSYQSGKPLLGFSEDFVKAGALAALYTRIGPMVTQVLESFTIRGTTGRLAAPAFPESFDVALNTDVARTLGLQHLDAEVLAHRIRQREARE